MLLKDVSALSQEILAFLNSLLAPVSVDMLWGSLVMCLRVELLRHTFLGLTSQDLSWQKQAHGSIVRPRWHLYGC